MLLLALMIAGCGTAPRHQHQAAPQTSATATNMPPKVSPIPSGTGSERADDVNGDGRADLAFEFNDHDRRYLAIVYGSPQGLDPATRAVISSDTFVPLLSDPVLRADLDDDGFGDVLRHGSLPGHEEQDRLHVFWGGPHGIDVGTPPTPIHPPAMRHGAVNGAVAGDFNGDGAADVAIPGRDDGTGEDGSLAVLYGPFSRDAVPARRTIQPSPTGGMGSGTMTADKIAGRRATGLVVHEADDGEQTAGWLLTAGRDGLSEKGRRLNKGMATAFGDFDGDGARDVVIGDDGSRNNEPPYETEAPSVDKVLTVYYGNGRRQVFRGTHGPAVSGDVDGDGRDDLAFGGMAQDASPTWLFVGGSGGLRNAGGVVATGGAQAATAGDYDGDGDDELAFLSGYDAITVWVTDGRKVLARFDTTGFTS
ncbi:hypothetical protein ACWDLG_21150 [Nonomuraea sp. NPDC003727]